MNITIAILAITLSLAAAAGWVLNIIQIFHTICDPITGLFIIKCVGVIMAPLGAILGWVGFF